MRQWIGEEGLNRRGRGKRGVLQEEHVHQNAYPERTTQCEDEGNLHTGRERASHDSWGHSMAQPHTVLVLFLK